MNTTRSATCLANPISCVTQSMVIPRSVNSTMVSSTSLTISGSSADVGSSNSMMRGCMHKALAMATRCCCPPDSCGGYLRSEEHTSELQSLMRISYAVFCLKKKKIHTHKKPNNYITQN